MKRIVLKRRMTVRTPKLATAILLLAMVSASGGSAQEQAFETAVEQIHAQLLRVIPIGERVLVFDLTDLDGKITPFGRYLAAKISLRMTANREYQVVDRIATDYVLKEQELQMSDAVDPKSAVKLGRIVGATAIIYGTVSELPDAIGTDIRVASVERGTLIGGASYRITKTREVASLVGTIMQKGEEQAKELEAYRTKVLADVETERQARVRAIDAEIAGKRSELDRLEAEIKAKSAVLVEAQARKAELPRVDEQIKRIHTEIDALNGAVLPKLKIGMSLEQVKSVLGESSIRLASSSYQRNPTYVVGKYFLLFTGVSLTRVVLLGSKDPPGRLVVDSKIAAEIYGVNVGSY